MVALKKEPREENFFVFLLLFPGADKVNNIGKDRKKQGRRRRRRRRRRRKEESYNRCPYSEKERKTSLGGLTLT